MEGISENLHLAPWLTGVGSALVCFGSYQGGGWLSRNLISDWKHWSPSDRRDLKSRFSSTFHAVAIALLAYLVLVHSNAFNEDSELEADARTAKTALILRTTPSARAALGVSLGYFTFDIMLLILYFPEMGGLPMLVHHIVSLASLVAALYQSQGHQYVLALLATEMTTPFINARWILDRLGLKDSKVYLANGLLLLACWFFGRIVLFTWFFHHLWQHRDEIAYLSQISTVLIVFVPVLLFGLNIFWFSKILSGAMKLFKGKKPRKELEKEL